MGIFSDTYSKISNFVPNDLEDPSRRPKVSLEEKNNLFQPFYLIDTTDILAEKIKYKFNYDSFLNPLASDRLNYLFSLGR